MIVDRNGSVKVGDRSRDPADCFEVIEVGNRSREPIDAVNAVEVGNRSRGPIGAVDAFEVGDRSCEPVVIRLVATIQLKLVTDHVNQL